MIASLYQSGSGTPSLLPTTPLPAVGDRQRSKPVRELGGRVALAHPPEPIALGLAGGVHARARVETEQVLHRRDGDVGHAGPRAAHHVPSDVAAVAWKVGLRRLV